MTRLKFVVFALAALGLWAAHLFLLSPSMAARAVEQASAQAAAAPTAIALRVQDQRIAVQKTALKLVGSGPIFNALKNARPGAPSPETFAPIRAVVNDALPEALKKTA